MIEELSIRNVGGIASASIPLGDGLTVLTGESGTGKSSVVRALELLGGKRSQASSIRAGQEEATVDAVLSRDVSGDSPVLLARRTISRGGRNRTWLDDRPVPLSRFSSVMGERLRIQSQFAQMELLDPKRQMDILDFFGGGEARNLLGSLRKVFEEALSCERSLRSAREKGAELRRRYRDGEAILNATHGLRLSPGCDAAWEKELEAISERVGRLRRIRECLLGMTGGQSGEGLLDGLESSGLGVLREISPEERGRLESLFSHGMDLFRRFAEELRKSAGEESLQELETEEEILEKKTGILRKIRRTIGASSAEEVLDYCEEARRASEWLQEEAARSSALEEQGKSLRKEASRLAMELRRMRQGSALELEKKVNTHLENLAMGDARFSVKLTGLEKIRGSGAEEVLFTLSSGGREDLPVDRCASGGELSRILLALQLSLPGSSLPPTIIFDEVEAGLGGRAALLAGYKLLELSRRCQVVLVTHEATIASLARRHLAVWREGDSVAVRELSAEERIAEIARMLSGNESLAEAREHARKLLHTAECLSEQKDLFPKEV